MFFRFSFGPGPFSDPSGPLGQLSSPCGAMETMSIPPLPAKKLKENMKQSVRGENWDFLDADNIPDDHGKGHGTRVIGVASAACNHLGSVGVAHNCKFIPLKVNLESGNYSNRKASRSWSPKSGRSWSGLRGVWA